MLPQPELLGLAKRAYSEAAGSPEAPVAVLGQWIEDPNKKHPLLESTYTQTMLDEEGLVNAINASSWGYEKDTYTKALNQLREALKSGTDLGEPLTNAKDFKHPLLTGTPHISTPS